MNKFLFSVLVGVLPFGGDVLGVSIPASGIDWSASQMAVSYIPELANSPAFSCFGKSESPATKSLDALGFSEGVKTVNINDCFQQAGDYEVTIKLVDKAENESSNSYEFTIAAASSDKNKTTLTAGDDCDSDSTSVLANNTDRCDLTLTLKDRFENPVNQIESVEISHEINPFSDDANTKTSFLDGLRWGSEALPSSTPRALSLTNGSGTIPLTAIAPSLQKVGDYLAKLVTRELGFQITAPEIDDDGSLSSSTKTISSFVDVAFKHLFELMPEKGELTIGTQGSIPITKTRHGGNDPSDLSGTLQNYNNDINTKSVDLESSYSFNTSSNEINTTIQSGSDPQKGLALGTTVTYKIDVNTVSYPAGGIGLADFNGGTNPEGTEVGYNIGELEVDMVGVDIEGRILGDKVGQLQTEAGIQSLQIADITPRDIRTKITENAHRLIRGSDNVQTGDNLTFDKNWFNTTNVAIAEGNVELSGELPSGKNTLIITDGNLLIKNNVTYNESTASNDSFGVILINDTHEKYPETGNIFVHPDVRQFVGTYYADGGLMANDDKNNTPENALNTDKVVSSGDGKNINQLLLTGTLFTRNTIGGAIAKEEKYLTPWEDLDSSDENKKKALRYDLHFVRQYAPQLENSSPPPNLIENKHNCAPDGGTSPNYSNCDENTDAFVIRVDRKASALPPPGFEIDPALFR